MVLVLGVILTCVWTLYDFPFKSCDHFKKLIYFRNHLWSYYCDSKLATHPSWEILVLSNLVTRSPPVMTWWQPISAHAPFKGLSALSFLLLTQLLCSQTLLENRNLWRGKLSLGLPSSCNLISLPHVSFASFALSYNESWSLRLLMFKTHRSVSF